MLKLLNPVYWLFLIVCLGLTNLSATDWMGPFQATPFYGKVSNDMDGSGNVITVWNASDGKQTRIEAAILRKGFSWVSLGTIGSSADQNYSYPKIAVNEKGKAVAVWEELYSFNNSCIKASILSAEQIWSPPIVISDPTLAYTGSSPQVVINSSGYTVVVWIESDAETKTAHAATLSSDGQWSLPMDIAPHSTDIQSLKVGMDEKGNAIAIWYDYSQKSVLSSSLPFEGSWTTPVVVSDNIDFSQPALAMNASGYAVTTYEKKNSDYMGLSASTIQFGEEWSAPIEISTKELGAWTSDVAVDANNNAAAIWEQQTEKDSMNNAIIQAAYLPFGGKWSGPVNISPKNIRSLEPQVTFDGLGNAIGVWLRDTVIQTATLPKGGNWSEPTQLSHAGFSLNPCVTADATGYSVINWTDGSSIQSSTFTPPAVITSISPDFGPEKGGNTVTITGTNFFGVYYITFGGIIVDEFEVISPTEITVKVPPGSGTVDVQTIGLLLQSSVINECSRYTYR